MIYQNSPCNCDSISFENCESLQNKFSYLVKTVDKLSKGKSNLETVLSSQNCVFGNLDCIAKNVIIYALDSNEFLKVSKCASAMDIWDTLESTHEGSSGIVWQYDDISSSGSSSEVTKPNLCLMTKAESTSV